ncbi:MAG: pyruvate dehydrogenase complex E1 component subunit beta [Paracoccaceae bacterium]|nr:pyruvate dehydrogenase complex E1 component subunit beta [Paracoccaceae bacterium]
MSVRILMPALSPTMTEGVVARWLVAEGDAVTAGQVIAEIETDKAIMELEAVDDGTVGKLLVPASGSAIAINTPIAVIVEEGENRDEALANALAETSSSAGDKTEARGDGETDARTGNGTGPVARPSTMNNTVEARADNQPPTDSRPAERDDTETDTRDRVTMTVRDALRQAMAEEMRSTPEVFLMGEEVAEYQGAYKVSQGLLEEFGPMRVIDTPITEHGFAGLAVGAAFAGLRPIVEFMTFNFAMQAIDQIVNSAAKTLYMSGGQMGCPIVFRGPNGAAARVAAQHSQDYAAWYSHIPGLKVIQPYSAADAKGLLKSAIRDPNPVIFLENEILYGRSFDVPDSEDLQVPIGKARVWRSGSDVTIVSFGIGMQYALEAADKLAKDGIEAEVLDLRTLRPMDSDSIIRSVRKTNRCVTVEEGFPVGSIGNHISALLMERAFDDLDAPVINCSGKDVPMPYAANLERLALVTTEEVIAAVKAVTYSQDGS